MSAYSNYRFLDVGIVVAVLVFISDQYSKYEMLELLSATPGRLIEMTSFFNLVMVWNRGVSFGMFSNANMPYALIAVAVVLVVVLGVWLAKAHTRYLALALGAIIGGALGNIVDRVQYGAVFDFLDVHAYGYHWPAFNIADSAIVLGVVVLFLDSMLVKQKPSAEDEQRASE